MTIMGAKPIILLIDDDLDDQEIFQLALQKANEEAICVFANDGSHALQQLNTDLNFTPDCIFIDMNMPRMNGMQCLWQLRQIDRLKEIPIYIYSTAANPVQVEEYLAQGAKDYIVKPSNINILIDMLRSILKKLYSLALLALFWVFLIPFTGKSQIMKQDEVKLIMTNELGQLLSEQASNIVGTPSSYNSENLAKTANVIQVAYIKDLQYTTTNRLPEALCLAKNMTQAETGSQDQLTKSKGFMDCLYRTIHSQINC